MLVRVVVQTRFCTLREFVDNVVSLYDLTRPMGIKTVLKALQKSPSCYSDILTAIKIISTLKSAKLAAGRPDHHSNASWGLAS